MRITYFLPCYKSDPAVLAKCVASIRAQEGDNERRLVTVNDGEAPVGPGFHGYSERMKALGIELVAVHNENKGLAASCNTALAACDTELFAKVDDDVVLAPYWERRCLNRLGDKLPSPAFGASPHGYHHAAETDIAAVGGRLIETVRSPADQWRAAFMPQGWQAFDFLSGFATIFRADSLRKIGGWDEKYKQNYEDVVLSKRLTGAGFRLIHDPGILAWHQKTDTIESALRTYWKWHTPAMDEQGFSLEMRREIWRNMAKGQIKICISESAITHLVWIGYAMFFACDSLDKGGAVDARIPGRADQVTPWPWPDDFDDAARFVLEASRQTLGGA